MALKNFSFRENWVGIEVAGIKIALLPFFDPIWNFLSRILIVSPYFLPQNGQKVCPNFLQIWCF